MPKLTDEHEHKQFENELFSLGFYWEPGVGWFHSSGRKLPPADGAGDLCQKLGIAYVSACRRLLLQNARKMVRSL